MVADAVVRHVMLVVKAREAIHGGAVVGHVVGLDGAVVVIQCEVMNPFLVNG